MDKFSKGSHSCFETLYGRYKDAVYRYALKSVQDSASAEDIAHESWVSVIDKAESFVPDASLSQPFKQWLYRIAHNKVIDFWRKQKHIDYIDEDQQEILENESGKDNHLEEQYLLVEVERLLAQLPPIQRQSYLLQLEGFSLAEIAEITNSQPESVKSRLRYGKKKLQQLLEDEA
ncbi:RNA polymerase sigma factor [Pseudoteredinibacter isoporae]|uniref:RNA polymerase sigma factor n=1 Tax=Pseudoteredinibacter isoporae TaxID=570281 RepID=UPI001FB64619|nr:sigma-70 family RNA polymerase sigma factor [Pseudoteredinibacter isoporae]